MELLLYPRLSTRSRRAIRRKKGRYGRSYEYRPYSNLVNRLSRETGQTPEWVLDQLAKEQDYLMGLDGATAL
jgi:hypothetical protein